LRLKQTRTVEVVIPLEPENRQHVSDPFFLDLLGAIADALTNRGFDMLVSKIAPWAREGRANSLVAGRADGIIIIGQGRRRKELRELAARHRAVVVWGASVDGGEYAVVGGDNREGGRLVASHLVALGRKRIAFFGDITLPEIAPRHHGYCDALNAAGVSVDPALTVNVPFDPETAFETALDFAAKGPRFDAVVAASDVIAMSAVNAFRKAGRNTPDDVAVTGYDDIFSAAWFTPGLTTISQSIQTGGARLVDILFRKMAGEEPTPVVLPPKLIVRQSCGYGAKSGARA
jgi:DNA-binding LacI/PurR family transcriptional regulator